MGRYLKSITNNSRKDFYVQYFKDKDYVMISNQYTDRYKLDAEILGLFYIEKSTSNPQSFKVPPSSATILNNDIYSNSNSTDPYGYSLHRMWEKRDKKTEASWCYQVRLFFFRTLRFFKILNNDVWIRNPDIKAQAIEMSDNSLYDAYLVFPDEARKWKNLSVKLERDSRTNDEPIVLKDSLEILIKGKIKDFHCEGKGPPSAFAIIPNLPEKLRKIHLITVDEKSYSILEFKL